MCYYLSRFIGKKFGTGVSGKNIKIIERVAFSQDKCLAICKICGSYYLIGVANQNIKILAELDPAQVSGNDDIAKVNFIDLFKKAKQSADNNQDDIT